MCSHVVVAIISDIKFDDPMSGERLYADIVAYSKQGEHRTTSMGSISAVDWFTSEMHGYGYNVDTLQFTLQKSFDLESCSLVLNSLQSIQSLKCFPVWLPESPSAVHNASIAIDVRFTQGKIFVFKINSIMLTNDTLNLIWKAIQNGCTGIILVNEINTQLGSVATLPVALNVEYKNYSSFHGNYSSSHDDTSPGPWPVPVVVVGSAYQNLLLADPPTVRIETLSIIGSSHENSNSTIVHAVLPVNEKSDVTNSGNHIIIDTGLSGWHRCGGERGPGIAITLGVARWRTQIKNRNYTYHFFGTTGHELGSIGLNVLLDWLPNQNLGPENVIAYLHPGSATVTYAKFNESTGSGVQYANVNYAKNGNLSNFIIDPLKKVGFNPQASGPQTKGGLAEIVARGYNAFGFWGAFPRFHTSDDDQTSTGPDLLEPVGHAILQALQNIEKQ